MSAAGKRGHCSLLLDLVASLEHEMVLGSAVMWCCLNAMQQNLNSCLYSWKAIPYSKKFLYSKVVASDRGFAVVYSRDATMLVVFWAKASCRLQD